MASNQAMTTHLSATKINRSAQHPISQRLAVLSANLLFHRYQVGNQIVKLTDGESIR